MNSDITKHSSSPSPSGTPPPMPPPPPAVLLVAGTSSGVGKTTLTCGLMAALSRRGLIVQPYKCGPDFLDGMHHETSIRAGREEFERERTTTGPPTDDDGNHRGTSCDNPADDATNTPPFPFVPRRTVNLDGWMMASATAGTHGGAADGGETSNDSDDGEKDLISNGEASIRDTFLRHSVGADVCVIEGCMGLHDSKDGLSDDGSTAQIAKFVNASVILVVDAGAMARSVAAMVLGYAVYDDGVMLDSVVANKVGGVNHVEWIRQAVEGLNGRVQGGKSRKSLSSRNIVFAGGMPRDSSAAVPERHLGLTMPGEVDRQTRSDRILRLATLVENSIDVDALLSLGRRRGSEFFSIFRSSPDPFASTFPYSGPITLPRTPTDGTLTDLAEQSSKSAPPPSRCRIGVAKDEAFCFYYADNLSMLERFGAEIVPFSPLHSDRLPPLLDALYLGGGYPELHAAPLERNATLREDVESFAMAGGVIYAECGGFMYLCEGLYVAPPCDKDGGGLKTPLPATQQRYEMCGIFKDVEVRMTPHMKMHYATIEFTSSSPIFSAGTRCRGQKFHFSEVFDEHDDGCAGGVEEEQEAANDGGDQPNTHPMIATPQTIRSVRPEQVGHAVLNTIASYYHLHFASNPAVARDLVESAIRLSPRRGAFAVSFVSAATEIAFAIDGGGECMSGVTSICDHPPRARRSPRCVVCESSIDAGSMSSEEVDAAVREMRERMERRGADVDDAADGDDEGEGPGVWKVNQALLRELSPRVVFVQDTCHICDPRRDDVLLALRKTGLLSKGRSDESTSQLCVIQVAPTTLEGMFESIDDVAASLGLQHSGAKLSGELRARLVRIEEELSRQGVDAPRPRVLSLEGLAPLCTGGNWLPDLKRAAGCDDALGDEGGAKARLLSWADIESSDPDALVVSPCSASPQRTFNEMHLLASQPSFWKLRCVQRGDVYVIDHGFFSRPGPRLVGGVELLARLFRGVPAPPGSEHEWAREVFKYECNVSSDAISSDKNHCTTELSQRFAPCFGSISGSEMPAKIETDVESSSGGQPPSMMPGLRRCVITRCTIPNHPHPSARSAHCMIPLTAENRLSFVIFSGEDSSGRLNDVWKLHTPSKGWGGARETSEDVQSRVGTTCVWEWQRCSHVAGEDVPTARSNSAAVACGDYLLVFGGWGKDNLTPLTACELLHLGTLCWTHCLTRGGIEPPPRGNPTLVYSPNKHIAILFGGWDGKRRLSDLWCLDLEAWEWSQIKGKAGTMWPKNRTDHTAVLWEKNDSEEYMIVYGGSVEGTGACSELWIFDCCERSTPGWTWRKISVNGPSPPGRSSHAASMIGSGNDAKMVISGGTNALTGCAKSGIFADAWILRNISKTEEMSWIQVGWQDPGLERCRHTMNVVGSNVVIWGGFDGEEAVDDEITLWHGSISDYVSVDTVVTIERLEKGKSKGVRLQERWKSEVPVREEDLPLDILKKSKSSKLPGAVYKAIHRYAVSLGRDTYIDPASGYSVFTQHYLKRRPCCGNGCRHCPHGHVNVPKKNTSSKQADEMEVHSKDMEW